MPRAHIGTAGWSYGHWHGGVFYPEDLKRGAELEFYAGRFDTVEINSSFYHLPQEKTCRGWAERTPDRFLFAVKASRFITHRKRLDDVGEPLANLLARVRALGPKLGPLLFQLSPSFRVDVPRLHAFLRSLPRDLRATFEFRHQSWFCDEVYAALEEAGAAVTISDTPRYPCVVHTTADFVYVRLHGHERLYASNYTAEQLTEWAGHARPWLSDGRDVFVYFDNDAEGHAPRNARELRGLVG